MIIEENEVGRKGFLRSDLSLKRVAYLGCKRIFDVLVASVVLILCSPIFLLVALLIRLDKDGGGGPALFTQIRIGQGGREFTIYKFRTMVPHADKELKKILNSDSEFAKEYRQNKKMMCDPRVTKIGRFLRRTSIDELPQFLNVLLGDMSVVGNRPYMIREKEDMGEFYDQIVKTKPGITGYWQVSGRNDISFEKRLELEAYYSQKQNFKMDVKILLATPMVVILGRGVV